LIGDSGGYQVATGALDGMKSWGQSPNQVADLWRRSSFKYDFLRWLDLHCNYGMTLDMPLWLKSEQSSASPFHHCSVDQLVDLTVENLQFFEKNRGRVGNCKFLNVIQGRTEEEEDYWYRRVRDFEFEGWALGGSDGRSFSIERVLHRLLLLRDDGMLGNGKEWLHVLGIAQLIWSVAFTAIQRGIQQSAGSTLFTVSFDSSTPFLWAGKIQKYAAPPGLTEDIKTWAFPAIPFPVSNAAATKNATRPFPTGSPLSALITLADVNRKASPYDANTFDGFSTAFLQNHNLYVFLRGFIDANERVFEGGLFL
jgi:hypothetical protein